MGRIAWLLAVLTGCIDFPEQPRCTPGSCATGLVCNPATALCVEGQDFGFLHEDQGVVDAGGADRDAGGAGGAGGDPGSGDGGEAGRGGEADEGVVVDAAVADAAVLDAQVVDAAVADVAVPDAGPPEVCAADDRAPRLLEGAGVTEVAIAAHRNAVLVAWTPASPIPGTQRFEVLLDGERQGAGDGLFAFRGRDLHAAGDADQGFALTWVEGDRVVVKVLSPGLDLLPDQLFAASDPARFPQILAVPGGWMVVWQEVAADGVRFVRGDLDAGGAAIGDAYVQSGPAVGNPAVPRAHTLVRRGDEVFLIWDPAPPAQQMPQILVARMAVAPGDRRWEVFGGQPAGQAPTAALLGGRVYVLWAGMNNHFLAQDVEQAPPPLQIADLAGRLLPRAVTDGDALGVMTCPAAVPGDLCSGLSYVRLANGQVVRPEWSHRGASISHMRLAAHSDGVAAVWMEELEGTQRALVKSSLLTAPCRRAR